MFEVPTFKATKRAIMTDKEGAVTPVIMEDKRDIYLSMLDECILILHKKIVKGRITDVKKEKLKLEQLKGIAYMITQGNKIYSDKQLDKLEKDIQDLKKGLIVEVPSKPDSSKVESDSLKKLEELDSKIEKLKE